MDYVALQALCKVIYLMTTVTEWSAHLDALAAQSNLGPALLRLLLAYVPALAVGLQLPADCRPLLYTWEAATHAAAVFRCQALLAAQKQELFTAATSSSDARRSVEKLLRSALLLMQHAPLPAAADLGGAAAAQQLDCCSHLAALLGHVAIGSLTLQPPLQPEAQLLALFPRLRSLLQCTGRHVAAGGQLHRHCWENVAFSIAAAVAALQLPQPRQMGAWNAVELQQWCSCAAELLRLVQATAKAARAADSAGVRGAAGGRQHTTAELICHALLFGDYAGSTVDTAILIAGGAQQWGETHARNLNQSSLAAVQAALLQLNTAGCRLVHFALTEAASSFQLVLSLMDLLEVAAQILVAAGTLQCWRRPVEVTETW